MRRPPRTARAGRLPRVLGALVLTFLGPHAPAAATGPPAAEPERPNILVLMAEDLSARVGAFGDPVARTPHLDALAAEGVRFPNTFTTAGVCAPSRAAFITGLHQISIGAQHMRTSTSPLGGYLAVPPANVKAFPELLRRAGYFTFTGRKLDYQFSGIVAGTGPFTIWDVDGVPDSAAGLPEATPFFGLLNFQITHESATFTPDSQAPGTLGHRFAAFAANARAALKDPVLPADVAVPPYYPDTPEVRQTLADFYNNVQVMDQEVGAIIEALRQRGLLEQTIVIWTTDHGDALPRAKRELFDSGIRVPMIIRWPERWRPADLPLGSLDERLISFVDLAPLILDLAGAERPDYLQGRNPFTGSPRDYVYASRDRMDARPDRVRAVRDARYKYLYYYRPGTPGAVHLAYRDQSRIMQALWQGHASGTLNAVQLAWLQPRPEESLYDLSSDPFELEDLAGDPQHAAVLTRMRTAFGAWRLKVPDLSDSPEAEMASRFWPDGTAPLTPAPVFTRLERGRIAIDATDNASIGYRIDGGRWQLYVSPITLAEGATLTARAVRYGYAESEEVSFEPLRSAARGEY